jgi:hypothetical protein
LQVQAQELFNRKATERRTNNALTFYQIRNGTVQAQHSTSGN